MIANGHQSLAKLARVNACTNHAREQWDVSHPLDFVRITDHLL
jgi:hypothetical protein